MSTISIVLKTVERCNLNCSYCYFFNNLDKSYLKRPKFISRETIDKIAEFLYKGAVDLNIKNIVIVLHRGEPLMQPKDDLIYMLEKFKSTLKDFSLTFSVQTNASLVTKKWIDLFNKYDINVGVSFDGPAEYHNKYRVDHYGNGSYDAVVKGVKLLQEHLTSKKVGCLTVINPEFSGKEIYRHIVELGFKSADFLFPDNNYYVPPLQPIEKYKNYLIEIFDEWIKDDNEKFAIRKFKSIILQLLGKEPLVYGFGKSRTKTNNYLLAIRSDGEVAPTDEFLSADLSKETFAGRTVYDSSLVEVVDEKIFKEIALANKNPPEKCSKCCWYQACGGGNLISRYSQEKRFNNHSIYCSAFEELYAHITAYLINSGINKTTISDNLFKKAYA